MTRQPPHEDWVVYLVVLGVVIAMMIGKYLIARGNKDDNWSKNDKS